MNKPISFALDTINSTINLLDYNIRQGEDLFFTIKLFQKGTSLNLTGQTVRVIVRRPNGNDTEIKTGDSRLTVSGNVITALFSQDYLVTDAIGDCKLEIYASDNNGGSISNRCVFTVEESLANDLVIKLDDKIDTLQEIDTFINNFNTTKDELEALNNDAKQTINNLENENDKADTNIQRLETDIANGTATAIRLEDDIVTGNQLDSNLKQDFVIGSSLLALLLTAIANGNIAIEQLQNVNWPYIKSMFSLLEKTLENQELTTENDVTLTDENDVALLF